MISSMLIGAGLLATGVALIIAPPVGWGILLVLLLLVAFTGEATRG